MSFYIRYSRLLAMSLISSCYLSNMVTVLGFFKSFLDTTVVKSMPFSKIRGLEFCVMDVKYLLQSASSKNFLLELHKIDAFTTSKLILFVT